MAVGGRGEVSTVGTCSGGEGVGSSSRVEGICEGVLRFRLASPVILRKKRS